MIYFRHMVLISVIPFASLLLMAAGGCDSSTEPDELHITDRVLFEELIVPVESDSVFFAIGTAGTSLFEPANVYFSSSATPSDSIKLALKVIGRTYDPKQRPVVDFLWSGDTLKVWCSHWEPWSWSGEGGYWKNSPIPPWLTPSDVYVVVPEDVGVRFIGHWYE